MIRWTVFIFYFAYSAVFIACNADKSIGNGRFIDQRAVFVSGTEGYHTFRIPALIMAPNGTLLAFAEGRKNGQSDTGDIDLVIRRSADNGDTWGPLEVVWDDNANVCGNPCPVVDRETGVIWLLLTHNIGSDHEPDIITKTSQGTRTVRVCKSEDNGMTWTVPKDVTSLTKDPSWGWYATGPGVGIQIEHGPHRGRLIIPCDHSYDKPGGPVQGNYEYGSHIIYSDDHGITWELGGVIRPQVNECQIVELADGNGSLLMNMRSYFGRSHRTISASRDGGITWTAPVDSPALVEPICQASIIRYRWPGQDEPGVLLFSNPGDAEERISLTVRMSVDDGETWPTARSIWRGPAAYSCLARLKDDRVGCLYECGDKHPYETITLARFKLGWLTEHAPDN